MTLGRFNKLDKNYSEHQLYYYRIKARSREGDVDWVIVLQKNGKTEFAITDNIDDSTAIISGICAIGVLNEVILVWNSMRNLGYNFDIVKFSHNSDMPILFSENNLNELLSDNVLFD